MENLKINRPTPVENPVPGSNERGIGYFLFPDGQCFNVGGSENHKKWLKNYAHIFTSPPITEVKEFIINTKTIRIRHLLTMRFVRFEGDKPHWRRDAIYTIPFEDEEFFTRSRIHHHFVYQKLKNSDNPEEVKFKDINVGISSLENKRFVFFKSSTPCWYSAWLKEFPVEDG
jgi:hypothetical protein